MPPKKQDKTVPEKVLSERVSMPIAAAPVGEVLGLRTVDRVVVKPIDDKVIDGRMNVEIRQTIERFDIQQPYLTYDEAKKLGKQKWHRHKMTGVFTCVVRGRRFMLDDDTFARLRNDGLIENT